MSWKTERLFMFRNDGRGMDNEGHLLEDEENSVS